MIARPHKGLVPAVRIGEHLAGVGLEFLDIELVVGEQHVVLEILGHGRGVMRQTGQGIVHALGGERRQGAGAAVIQFCNAVYDVVIRGRQIRHVKDIAQRVRHRPFLRHGDVRIARHCKMHGDRCG